MDIVSRLHGRSYRWKPEQAASSSESTSTDPHSEENRGERVLGFIAQELQRVVPEVVRVSSKGYLVVAYAELIPILVEAFKTHMDDMKKQNGAVEDLKATSKKYEGLKDAFMIHAKAATDRLLSLSEKAAVEPPSTTRHRKRPTDHSNGAKKDSATVDISKISPRKGGSGGRRDSDSGLPSQHPLGFLFSCATSKLIAAAIAVLLLVVVVIIAIVFGTRAQAGDTSGAPGAPSSGPVSPPIGFGATNYYVSDPGFEDPSASLWGGNHTYYAYGSTAKRSALESRFPKVDNASLYFNAGKYAVYIFEDPQTTELPQYPTVGLQQEMDFPTVLSRLRNLKTPAAPFSWQPAPSSSTPSSPPVSSPVAVASPFSVENLFLNITLWVNRDYASGPAVRDASWVPHDIWISLKLVYRNFTPVRETIIKQPLDYRVARGWQRHCMATVVSLPTNTPLPSRAVISFFSSMPGHVFFDAVEIDSRLL